MKFVYFYNEFDAPDVKADLKYVRLANVLTDVDHDPVIDEVLSGIEEVKKSGVEWDMSFNKSYLNITPERARCGDLYNESDFVDVKCSQLKEALWSWKKFLAEEKIKKKEILIK